MTDVQNARQSVRVAAQDVGVSVAQTTIRVAVRRDPATSARQALRVAWQEQVHSGRQALRVAEKGPPSSARQALRVAYDTLSLVDPPWSEPAYVNSVEAVVLPWSEPGYVEVRDLSIGLPPWSEPGQITLRAPTTVNWRRLKGSQIYLPTPAGYKQGIALAPTGWPVYTVNEMLASPLFEIAHRGFGALRPEMTMSAYSNAAMLGAQSLEVSVIRSKDGYWVCAHDDSTLRMTGQDFYIPTTPWVGVLDQLRVSWKDTDTPTQTEAVPLALLDHVVEEFGRSHVLWIQPKRDIDAQALVTWLNNSAYIDQEHVILKFWRGQYPYAVYGKANGDWKSWGIWFKANRMAWMEYFDILGQEWDAPQALWDGLLVTGKRVVGHVLDSTLKRDVVIDAGGTGLMSMRPLKDVTTVVRTTLHAPGSATP